MKKCFTFDEENEIIEKYKSGISIKEIFDFYKRGNKCTIQNILKRNNIDISIKHKDLEPFKKEIINLYNKEYRGKSYLAKLYSTNDGTINYFLKKWVVKTHSRSIISKKIREIYGVTKGFKGRIHSKETKEKQKIAIENQWKNGSRHPMQSKSKTFKTIFGNMQGTYEIAYIKKLMIENKPLPKKCNKGIKSPIGYYFPDFEFEDKFIEIKSKFTFDVMNGDEKGWDGKLKTRSQKEKIDWVSLNVKPVEIIIIDGKESWEYFKKEVKDKNFLLEDIIIKYKQYKK